MVDGIAVPGPLNEIVDLKSQISDFRFQISNLRFQISEHANATSKSASLSFEGCRTNCLGRAVRDLASFLVPAETVSIARE